MGCVYCMPVSLVIAIGVKCIGVAVVEAKMCEC